MTQLTLVEIVWLSNRCTGLMKMGNFPFWGNLLVAQEDSTKME